MWDNCGLNISVCLCVCVCASIQAAEVERQLSTQVHSLRDDFREKSMSTSQHMTRLETLQAEVSRRRCRFSFTHHFILSADDWIGLSWVRPSKNDTHTHTRTKKRNGTETEKCSCLQALVSSLKPECLRWQQLPREVKRDCATSERINDNKRTVQYQQIGCNKTHSCSFKFTEEFPCYSLGG